MRRRRKQLSPAKALVFLVFSAGVAGWSIYSHYGGRPSVLVAPAPAVAIEPDFDPSDDVTVQDEGPQGTDLLARHGSFSRSGKVRFAFARPEPVTASMATPGGETAPRPGPWRGADPPELKLGVIMISAAACRVVLGGRVVGVGDVVDPVTIVGIHRDYVVTRWSDRTLTYDLLDGWPREFRPERDRRARAAGADDTDAAPPEREGARAEGQSRRGQE